MVGEAVVIGSVVASADSTLAGKVACRDAVVDLVASAAYIDVMLHDGGVLVEYGFDPVRSCSESIRIVEGRDLAGVQASFIHHDSIFSGIEH